MIKDKKPNDLPETIPKQFGFFDGWRLSFSPHEQANYIDKHIYGTSGNAIFEEANRKRRQKRKEK